MSQTSPVSVTDWPAILAKVIERVTRHDVEIDSVMLRTYTTSVDVQVDGGEDAVDDVAPEFAAGEADPLLSIYARDGMLGAHRVRIYSGRTRPAGCCTSDCPCRAYELAPVVLHPVEGRRPS